jgi:hypothetical protein
LISQSRGLGDVYKRQIFPISNAKNMGFTKSHFIGYYTWIFDIPQGKKGFIRQD